MRMHEPEMNAAAGESRNTIAAEISDSVPSRPERHLLAAARGCARAISGGYWSSPDDAIQPGATALTRTGAHSSAAVSVKLSMPARAAPEWPMSGMPFHMSAIMFTIAPPCCFIHCV